MSSRSRSSSSSSSSGRRDDDDDDDQSSSRGSDRQSEDEDGGNHGNGGNEDNEEEEEDEGEDGYRPGGYHRVHIGDELGGWTVRKKLGWGHFSTVWLVQHGEAHHADRGGAMGALKIQKAADHYTAAAKDEIAMLRAFERAPDTVSLGKRFVVRLMDDFVHSGPNGNHAVMVFEVLGDNLLTLIRAWKYQGMPVPLVRQITWQVCAGLDFLHRQLGVIHTDLKPENVLICGLSSSMARRMIKPQLVSLDTLALVGRQRPCDARGIALATASPQNTATKQLELIRSKIDTMRKCVDDPELKGPARRHLKKKLRGLAEKLEGLAMADAGEAAHEQPQRKETQQQQQQPFHGSDDDEEDGWTQVGTPRSAAPSSSVALAEYVDPITVDTSDAKACGELFRGNFYSSILSRYSYNAPHISPGASSTTPPSVLQSVQIEDANDDEDVIPIAALVCKPEDLKLWLPTPLAPGQRLWLRMQNSAYDFCVLSRPGPGLATPNTTTDLRKLKEALKVGEKVELDGSTKSRKRHRAKQQHAAAAAHSAAPKPFVVFEVACKASAHEVDVLRCVEHAMPAMCVLRHSRPIVNTSPVAIVPAYVLVNLFAPDIVLRPGYERLPTTTAGSREFAPPPPFPRFMGALLGTTKPHHHLDIAVKIVDFGNSCYRDDQISEDIQTRQYRSPEVIMRAPYDCSADMWSLACLVFELLTGDTLFDPRSRRSYSRDEDHIALITELIGYMPAHLRTSGRRARSFIDPASGQVRRVPGLKFMSLQTTLERHHGFSSATARQVTSFLRPLLEWDPARRATAEQALKHSWVKDFQG